jgi:hypothetical protein
MNISRKKFLQLCGSFLAGGSILSLSGFVLGKRFLGRNDFSGGNRGVRMAGLQDRKFTSPYMMTSSFRIPEVIEAFEVTGDRVIVATANSVRLYDYAGRLLNNFAVGSNLRDIVVDQDNVYLLFPGRVEVYDNEGELLRDWEACSDRSDYCSMAVAAGYVFVTDAGNKVVCKYSAEGDLVKFIRSPEGFIIPSYTFGITCADGVLYCSNSGRHRVEKYTLDGEYLGAFGRAGGAAGMFCGCCNPVHLVSTSGGDIITSEKGNPRVSCYGTDGEFRSLLLDREMLGGGNMACEVKVRGDKLFVAGKNRVSTFRYSPEMAGRTACSTCHAVCPLKV